jgi:hypothetical protein
VSEIVRRIDPKDCGCTDCLIGWSVPIDQARAEVFDRYAATQFDPNFRGWTVTDASSTTDREFDCYALTAL